MTIGEETYLISLYVDDIFIAGSDPRMVLKIAVNIALRDEGSGRAAAELIITATSGT